MTYEAAVQFAQIWGLVLMVLLFAGALLYALWPHNRFERAAQLPLIADDADE